MYFHLKEYPSEEKLLRFNSLRSYSNVSTGATHSFATVDPGFGTIAKGIAG